MCVRRPNPQLKFVSSCKYNTCIFIVFGRLGEFWRPNPQFETLPESRHPDCLSCSPAGATVIYRERKRENVPGKGPRCNVPESVPAQDIPLLLKLVVTMFVAVLVPIYWRYYGPGNFLWFSDLALFLTLAALWLESPLLASTQAVSV